MVGAVHLGVAVHAVLAEHERRRHSARQAVTVSRDARVVFL